MAGLVPAIHALANIKKDVDARHKAGHDGGEKTQTKKAAFAGGLFLFTRYATERITDSRCA
jgi:hypothetical protein